MTNDDDEGESESANDDATATRRERISREMELCGGMKVGELKKELESYGVSTRSYFEKSEFVRAVAEARVDGKRAGGDGGPNGGGGGSTGSSGDGGGNAAGGYGRAGKRAKEEPRDPSYRDVIVSKFPGNKGLLEGKIMDVRAR